MRICKLQQIVKAKFRMARFAWQVRQDVVPSTVHKKKDKSLGTSLARGQGERDKAGGAGETNNEQRPLHWNFLSHLPTQCTLLCPIAMATSQDTGQEERDKTTCCQVESGCRQKSFGVPSWNPQD